MVTPVATTDYTGNSAADGSGVDRTSSLTVVAASGSTARRIVITNAHFDTVYLTKLQLRGKGIYRYQAAPAIALDQESIQKYGTATLDLDMPYQQNIGIAQSLATAVAEIYGQPTTRPQRMTLAANHDDATMTQALTREIGDHIGIAETVSGLVAGTGYFIHEVDMECSGLKNLTVTWGLIPSWPERLLVSYTGPVGTQVHDLDVAPLVVSDAGDYTFVFNKTGNSVVVRGAAGGGGGGGGRGAAGGGGGGAGGAGAINATGITVAIATTTYTGKVGIAGSGGAAGVTGTAGGTSEFRVPSSTIHLQLPGGSAGAGSSSGTGGAGGGGGAAGTGAGNVAGSVGGAGGTASNGVAGTNNTGGSAGGGGGGSEAAFNGGNGGNGLDIAGGAGGSGGGAQPGATASGVGGSQGSGANSGGGGGGGGGVLLGGGYRGGGGGGGAAATSTGGAGGNGGVGALSLTKV
jgi:hypothetical protein